LALYFLDNDVVLKLSAYNLFWQVTKVWGIEDEEIRVLKTAAKVFQHDSKILDQYDDRTRNLALSIVNQRQKVASYDQAEVIQLTAIEGIDVGEAVLVAATAGDPDPYIATADKRFLKALATSRLTTLLMRLEHRFICLEQLMIRLIQQEKDFQKIARRIAQAVDCELSITQAFQRGKDTDPAQAVRVLEQAVEELRRQTGTLLMI
jgi:2C-methyl-D-erythritol 2,4-cyclodiphosphate synthase